MNRGWEPTRHKWVNAIIGIIALVIVMVGFYLLSGGDQQMPSTDEDREFSVQRWTDQT